MWKSLLPVLLVWKSAVSTLHLILHIFTTVRITVTFLLSITSSTPTAPKPTLESTTMAKPIDKFRRACKFKIPTAQAFMRATGYDKSANDKKLVQENTWSCSILRGVLYKVSGERAIHTYSEDSARFEIVMSPSTICSRMTWTGAAYYTIADESSGEIVHMIEVDHFYTSTLMMVVDDLFIVLDFPSRYDCKTFVKNMKEFEARLLELRKKVVFNPDEAEGSNDNKYMCQFTATSHGMNLLTTSPHLGKVIEGITWNETFNLNCVMIYEGNREEPPQFIKKLSSPTLQIDVTSQTVSVCVGWLNNFTPMSIVVAGSTSEIKHVGRTRVNWGVGGALEIIIDIKYFIVQILEHNDRDRLVFSLGRLADHLARINGPGY